MESIESKMHCRLCPRECGVNRMQGEKGYCKQTDQVVLGRAALHFWEEPCLSGTRGSGTVFFAGCNMGCVFCQNKELAHGTIGKRVTIQQLAAIFLKLQHKGAHNINLVTPTHYIEQIKEALILAKGQGLNLPIIYNCGGYEKVESLKALEGLIDIYLPDYKYEDSLTALKYSNARNYPECAKKAIAEMVRQCSKVQFNQEGIMISGVLVRHLLLPGHLYEAKRIVSYLWNTYGSTIYMSLMNQYTPLESVQDWPELNTKVKNKVYNRLVDYAIELGIENAFIQEGETAKESFIPEFNGEGV